ncbi:MAG: YitT family protein [Bacillaceae bacterium]|nr:YitT family protein [Bacillaceae bacterium]
MSTLNRGEGNKYHIFQGRRIVSILMGSLFLDVGINVFLVPWNLLDGGMIGVSLIIHYLTGLKVGLTMILLSIPIYWIAWVHNRSYFYNSLHGMLVSSFMIDLLSPLREFGDLDILSSAILGGIFVGVGIGIMLRYHVSTGGTDLLAQFLSDLYRINVGIMIFFIDALVILAGFLVLDPRMILYSLVTIFSVGTATSLCTWKVST